VGKVSDAFYVKLDSLLFGEPVAAGMNPLVIMSLTYLFRGTNENVEPITIRREGESFYRIVDGRHRAVASMIAGRKTVLAEMG
jgi:uncharacterized ParB-like nuclease family protein